MYCDQLEARRMFASVTLVTHGYAPSGSAPGWTMAMAKSIAKREGGADIFKLTIRGRGDDAGVSGFKQMSSAGSGLSGDVIIVLDWAKSSDVFGEMTPANRIAALVRPFLLEARPETGRGPLGELPIHLIGHSRGGSVVTELAKDLGQRGMWVDQVTTLDPVPVNDPDPEAWENITFFDNYYQHKTLNLIVNGRSIDGARNIDLSDVFDFALLDEAHKDVWAYYGGTVDLGAGSFSGNDVESDWYDDDDTGPRGQKGFAWSKAVGRDRPNMGNRFRDDGVKAQREDLNVQAEGADRWDNVSFSDAFGPTALDQGQGVAVPLHAVDVNGDAMFSLLLDTDDNPYNGGLIETGVTMTTSGEESVWSPTIDTSGIGVGTYYVVARVSNGTHTRQEYSTGAVTVLPPGTGANGTVMTFDAVRKVTYVDGAGNRITPKLTGPGSGVIVFPGEGTSPSVISLSGTSVASSFTLSGKATSVGTLQVSGSLKSLSAANASIGGLTLGGTATTVSLGGLSGKSTVSGLVKSFSVKSVSGALLSGTVFESVKISAVSTSAVSTVEADGIGSITAPGLKAKPGVSTEVPGLVVKVG